MALVCGVWCTVYESICWTRDSIAQTMALCGCGKEVKRLQGNNNFTWRLPPNSRKPWENSWFYRKLATVKKGQIKSYLLNDGLDRSYQHMLKTVTFQKFWKMKIIYSFLSALLVVKIWMSSIWSGPGPASEKRRKMVNCKPQTENMTNDKKFLNKLEGGRELEIYIFFFLFLNKQIFKQKFWCF